MITKITGSLQRVLDEEVRLISGAFEYAVQVPEFVRRALQARPGGAPGGLKARKRRSRLPDVDRLTRGGSLAGTVVDASGRGAGNLTVIAQGSDPTRVSSTAFTQADGSFRFRGLASTL